MESLETNNYQQPVKPTVSEDSLESRDLGIVTSSWWTEFFINLLVVMLIPVGTHIAEVMMKSWNAETLGKIIKGLFNRPKSPVKKS